MKRGNGGDSRHVSGRGSSIYLWGLGGTDLHLPEGVGFKIGEDSKAKYLILQMHYINIDSIPKEGDSSGVYLRYTTTPQSKTAGMISMHVKTRLPPRTVTFQDVSCTMGEDRVLHPFGALMHTHAHGHVVSAWRVRRDLRGVDQWTAIGRRDAGDPQNFYPPNSDDAAFARGDRFAFRCTMMNWGSNLVLQGLASYNEMCDLYLMYWTVEEEGGELAGDNFCWSPGNTVHPKKCEAFYNCFVVLLMISVI